MNRFKKRDALFMGFMRLKGFLFILVGNQCALVTKRLSPCHLKRDGSDVNWDNCDFNNLEVKTFLEKNEDKITVYPDEFPDGISLIHWIKYIMK